MLMGINAGLMGINVGLMGINKKSEDIINPH